MINERMQEWGRTQARRVADWLKWTGLTPNMLTIIGLLLNIVVAAVLARGHLFVGGILVIAAGLLIYLLSTPDATRGSLLIYATICGSIMVSYARARAEGLGYKLQNGLLARPERIIIFAAGLILGHVIYALWFLAIFTNITACQRIYTLWSTTTPPRTGRKTHDTRDSGPRPGEQASGR
jgi:CDP-diacylglycerol---glycerol-3-phosphate 3-phosphatidyltransferase